MASIWVKARVEYILIALISLIFISSVLTMTVVDGIPLNTSLMWTIGTILSTIPLVWGQAFYELPSVKLFAVINQVGYLILLSLLIGKIVNVIATFDVKGYGIARRIGGLKRHFIICGYFKVGEKICEILREHRVPYVIIDNRSEVVEELKEKGELVVEGDPKDYKVLERGGVKWARGLAAVLALDDASNLFTVLAAKELNPNLIIAARAYSEDVVSKMHRAGAEIVVMPEVVGGLELGKEILRKDGVKI